MVSGFKTYNYPAVWNTSERSRAWVRWALWSLLILMLVEGVVAVLFRDNDFLWHVAHGRAFLRQTLTWDHYLPARGFMDSLLTLAPYHVTRCIVYVAALCLLFQCWRLWTQMAAGRRLGFDPLGIPAGTFAVLLFLPYLLRDFDECGLQIILLFFLTMGGSALARGKPSQAGFWLALSACYKVTPLICLPFLVWKRQWRAAAAMAVFMAIWCAMPALWTGWRANLHAHEQWWAEFMRRGSAHEAYPSLVGYEPPEIYNLSLQAAIARNLETYPPGHNLYVDQPGFMQPGRLSAQAAYYAVLGILGALALLYAWQTRRRWTAVIGTGSMPLEWASLCALCALLSPLCWKHHLVLALPCAYLVLRKALAAERSRWSVAGLCAIGLVIYGCRDFVVGRNLATLLLSYKLDTIAMCGLVIWTLRLSPALLPRQQIACARNGMVYVKGHEAEIESNRGSRKQSHLPGFLAPALQGQCQANPE
jgi:hypothetical protein